MVIDFPNMEEAAMPHFKGGEGTMHAKAHADEINRIMRIRMVPGSSVGEHTHDTSSEIIFALSGEAVAICDGKEEVVKAGMCHYCPKGHTHSMKNVGTEDFVGYAVVPQQ
ncbi:MAG: cupin domain-containing protein [Selenomonadaceae bacterium]